MTDALNFLLHFAGNVVKMTDDNLRYYYFLLTIELILFIL